MSYRGGVRLGIANRLMARLGSSALAGSLSSDGVIIKIRVVIQPYEYQPFHEMLQINEFNQGGPELPEGSVTVPEPTSPEVYFWCWGIKVAKENYYHSYQKKNKNKNIEKR